MAVIVEIDYLMSGSDVHFFSVSMTLSLCRASAVTNTEYIDFLSSQFMNENIH